MDLRELALSTLLFITGDYEAHRTDPGVTLTSADQEYKASPVVVKQEKQQLPKSVEPVKHAVHKKLQEKLRRTKSANF